MRALQELEAMERRAKEMEERAREMAAELVKEKQTKAAEAENRLREMERLVLSLLFVLRRVGKAKKFLSFFIFF